MYRLLCGLGLLLAVLILPACVSVGGGFEISRVDELKPGVSTVEDAIRVLGTPMSESTLPSGARILQWNSARAGIFGATATHAAILFDEQGVMTRVTHKARTL
jgi:hypothetical protein